MQINKYFSCVGSQDVYSGSSYSYTINLIPLDIQLNYSTKTNLFLII